MSKTVKNRNSIKTTTFNENSIDEFYLFFCRMFSIIIFSSERNIGNVLQSIAMLTNYQCWLIIDASANSLYNYIEQLKCWLLALLTIEYYTSALLQRQNNGKRNDNERQTRCAVFNIKKHQETKRELQYDTFKRKTNEIQIM